MDEIDLDHRWPNYILGYLDVPEAKTGEHKGLPDKIIFEPGMKPQIAGAVAKRAVNPQIGNILTKEVAYIPIDVLRFYRLHSSNLTNYINSPAMAMHSDLGSVGIKK